MGLFDNQGREPIDVKSKPPLVCSLFRMTFPVPTVELKGYRINFTLPLHMGPIAGVAFPLMPPECVEFLTIRIDGKTVAEFREGYDCQGRRMSAGEVLAQLNGRGGYWQHSADLVLPFGCFDRVWGLDLTGAQHAELSLTLDNVAFTTGRVDMAVLFGYSADPRRQF